MASVAMHDEGLLVEDKAVGGEANKSCPYQFHEFVVLVTHGQLSQWWSQEFSKAWAVGKPN
ncbi:hypothetical protein E2562_001265 [Oryza meyeriana var. granulata]|uniref:Uncharacterized protein n=1 Tax=Oryza meyeriana var. granulata TaxID=110450 RepID=A0A6G1DE72_9ORYZ|nr:hypothetical protein E2562_001265 [Oryza meyeriana var. granulata]